MGEKGPVGQRGVPVPGGGEEECETPVITARPLQTYRPSAETRGVYGPGAGWALEQGEGWGLTRGNNFV